MRFCRYLLLALLVAGFSDALNALNEIDARTSIIASSEPVSIEDMVSGWDGDYQKGELAYADIIWDIGFAKTIDINDKTFGKLRISKGYRIYYYLKFDEETAD
ncbi:hypothetical protein A9R00_07485, partial [Oleispira antarctica]